MENKNFNLSIITLTTTMIPIFHFLEMPTSKVIGILNSPIGNMSNPIARHHIKYIFFK